MRQLKTLMEIDKALREGEEIRRPDWLKESSWRLNKLGVIINSKNEFINDFYIVEKDHPDKDFKDVLDGIHTLLINFEGRLGTIEKTMRGKLE